jgi:hypothetical protein
MCVKMRLFYSYTWDQCVIDFHKVLKPLLCSGHAVALLVEAICYKSEGRGFGSRWAH